jgi:hypothetical protein
MKRRKNLWFQGAALLLIAITLLLAPGAGAQSKYKTLHRFRAVAGGHAPAGLIFDQSGNLYGTTALAGVMNSGTVFKLTPTKTEAGRRGCCTASAPSQTAPTGKTRWPA